MTVLLQPSGPQPQPGRTPMDFLHDLATLDIAVYRAINAYCGSSPLLDRAVVHMEVLKGPLYMGLFGLLWFQPGKEQLRRREMLIAIVLAVAVALVANRALSTMLPFRTRPMYDIGANAPSFEWHADLEHWSSFPSDNATYLFAIAAGLWRIAPGWGLFFGVFSACAAFARVFVGIHYPSDVIVGALIGIAVGLLVVRRPLTDQVGQPLLSLESWQPGYFYGALFLVTAELGSGFPNTRRIGVAIVRLFVGFKT